jgi:hypothetical protein
LTDAEFWSLIDTSRCRARGSPSRQEAILRRLLKDFSPDDVAEFKVRFDNLIRKAYHWHLWGAAYVIGGGCSDDGFWDFRSWLVSRGKRVYRAALRNPESLAGVVSRKDRDRSWKCFLNPAPFVWEEQAGRDTSECPRLGSNLGQEPEGQRWDEEDLRKLFPRLWKEFGW